MLEKLGLQISLLGLGFLMKIFELSVQYVFILLLNVNIIQNLVRFLLPNVDHLLAQILSIPSEVIYLLRSK